MDKPLVSVVMVVCNVDRFLSESIESILGQTFRDFELIIVDFGSTDHSKSIVSSYAAADSRVKTHAIPHCRLGEARKAACSLALGKYIAIMDADDVAAPHRLALQIKFMESHPRVGVVGGATRWIDAAGRHLGVRSYPIQDHEIHVGFDTRCPFCQPTVLIRCQAYSAAGGYRSVFHQMEDYDLWVRIAEHFECADLPEVVLDYRIHAGQVSLTQWTEQTICILAAQASALARRTGKPDLLDDSEEITAATLARLGVTEAALQSKLALELRRSIRWMCLTGDYAAALNRALDFLKSGLTLVEPWQIAALHLTTASLYWKDGKPWNSLIALGRAVAARPLILAHPFRPLLCNLGVVKRSALR